MAKSKSLMDVVMWIVGILVSLAVGFGMTDKVLVVRWIPPIITVIAGWIVVIGTIIGIIMALTNK